MTDHFEPAYLTLLATGDLARRVHLAQERLKACDICPRRCGGNRYENSCKAACGTGELAIVASYGPHLGEEKPLRGYRGSGTIFFSRCNLGCVYCQNYDISQHGNGQTMRAEELAVIMLDLQEMGCHNINLVSPSHVVPQAIAAVLVAAQAGLRLPLVYNSGGYDALETLLLLDGVVDIYMPDMKYADAAVGRRLSGVPDYPAVNQQAVKEMHRQVGDLQLDLRGIARRGVLIRHLVLPNGLAGTDAIVRFLATEISTGTYLNLMDQYRPCFQANKYPELTRRISSQEYSQAHRLSLDAGLCRLDS